MTKKEARSLYRRKREELADNEIERLQDLVLIQFQQLDLPFIKYLHTYLPSDRHREVDTWPVIDFLQFRNPALHVVVPRVDPENVSMRHFLFDESMPLQKNRFDILEPMEGREVAPGLLDLVIVPLLAFDTQGNRVGYGKGYYDRFLPQCREDVLRIGLSFFDPATRIADADDLDIPLTHCVTPSAVYEF